MKQPFNFAWRYKNDFKEDYLTKFPTDSEVIDIPHSLVEVPYNYFDEDSYQFMLEI